VGEDREEGVITALAPIAQVQLRDSFGTAVYEVGGLPFDRLRVTSAKRLFKMEKFLY
jgi:hypothetical protein